MYPGDEITIEPAELVAGGAALARIDGFPIFAANVYPGDVAVVRLTEVRKGFARAELVRITRPSALRRSLPCPVAGECGGCDWTALRLDAQLLAKERILRESLRRIGKVQSHPPIALHPSPLNYRMRSRLHRDGDAVGFYAAGSHRVVPLARECEVVGLETAQHPVEGETWEIDGRIFRGDVEIEIHVDPFKYRLSTSSFFQVNRHLLSTMIRLVTAHAARVRQPRTAIDLYAGVGFFTLPLANIFERVIAVEGGPVEYTRLNVGRASARPVGLKSDSHSNVEVIHSPVESFEIPDADFIFLDPPREGARKGVIDAMGNRAREMVCYLSCDPVTFSRDASRLIASGWRLASLDLLDLFPNTHHVETLASFERAE
jgi:23S rRNA (uracil1939-C5)-methyltransferase